MEGKSVPTTYKHSGITCDGCSISNFVGVRMKCLLCADFDLCSGCFQGGGGGGHDRTHPMQPVLPPRAHRLMRAGLKSEDFEDVKHEIQFDAFVCPLCGGEGMDLESLVQHSLEDHDPSENSAHVVCPVCVAEPRGNHSRRSAWISHMSSHAGGQILPKEPSPAGGLFGSQSSHQWGSSLKSSGLEWGVPPPSTSQGYGGSSDWGASLNLKEAEFRARYGGLPKKRLDVHRRARGRGGYGLGKYAALERGKKASKHHERTLVQVDDAAMRLAEEQQGEEEEIRGLEMGLGGERHVHAAFARSLLLSTLHKG